MVKRTPAVAAMLVSGVLVAAVVLFSAIDRGVRDESPLASVASSSAGTTGAQIQTPPGSPGLDGAGPQDRDRADPTESSAAEERSRLEAEERARSEEEARQREEAKERARREAEERSRREAEDRARREEEARQRQEAEQNARRESQRQLESAAHEYAARVTPDVARAAANVDVQAEATSRYYAESIRCWGDDSLDYMQKLEQCVGRSGAAYDAFMNDPGSYRQERYDYWYPQYYESYYWEFIRHNTR